MRVMLLQPLYLPWIGMFDMMSQCDLFIFYDDAQYSKQSWQSRNRIKTPNGMKWLSISIDRDYKLCTAVSKIRVNHQTGWVERNLAQIKEAYRKAPYFSDYFPTLSDFLLKTRSEWLTRYTAGSVKLIADILGIKTKCEYSSSFNITKSHGAQKVVDICLAVGADEYLDGASGRELYAPDFFSSQGIKIYFHDYEHPVYRQLHGEFISHLSVVDLLFNEGPDSLQILQSGGRNEFKGQFSGQQSGKVVKGNIRKGYYTKCSASNQGPLL